MIKKANKGEWSEVYAFLKILQDKQLPAADCNLEIIKGKSFIFQKIIRTEQNGRKIYDLSLAGAKIWIVNNEGQKQVFSTKNLATKTQKILERIRGADTSSFAVPEAQVLMQELGCTQLKADNSRKADIVAMVKDRISATTPELGFSVKSMLGSPATLLNAGQTTNFVFWVDGFTGDCQEINQIDTRTKIQDRLAKIQRKGGRLVYQNMVSTIFASNLRRVDTVLERFVAQMLVDFFTSKTSRVAELCEKLAQNSGLKREFGLSLPDYEYKIKNFLDAVALGMVPSQEWDGFSEAQGGYIVVRQDGAVVCYHLYNRDEFREYLYRNTKLESASSSRHKYGVLYERDGQLFIDLNLQVRFVR